MATRYTARLLGRLQSRVAGPSRARPVGLAKTARYAGSLAVVAGGIWLVNDRFDDLNWWYLTPRFTLHAESAVKPDPPSSSEGGFRVDPDTNTPFPLSLRLVSSPSLTLVGLGVRTVSFLRVKVYSAGFYLEDSITKSLDSVNGWHTFSAQHLLTLPTTSPGDPLSAPQLSGEALIGVLLDHPVTCAVRIVPVRNTDFSHLRDGFTRAIAARQKLARSNGKLSEADEERIAQSTQTIKSIFPAHSVPKGKALTLLRTAAGALIFEYEGKVLGRVDDAWVSKEMMLAYFADKDVISPKLKEDVARGLEEFIKH